MYNIIYSIPNKGARFYGIYTRESFNAYAYLPHYFVVKYRKPVISDEIYTRESFNAYAYLPHYFCRKIQKACYL